MSSERQTLILAGEALPQRLLRPLTIVATPADFTPLLPQGGELSEDSPESRFRPATFLPHQNIFPGAAGAYARTQALKSGSRTPLIDTYA